MVLINTQQSVILWIDPGSSVNIISVLFVLVVMVKSNLVYHLLNLLVFGPDRLLIDSHELPWI